MLSDLSTDDLRTLAESIAQALPAPRPPSRLMDRWIVGIVSVFSIISLIFTFGVNWSRIASIERQLGDVNVVELQKRLEIQQGQVTQMGQVLNQQATGFAVMQTQLEQIRMDVAAMRAILYRKP